MATAWIVAGLTGAVAGVAIRCLPPLHPGQLWTVPWAAVTVLYAAQLLPYKDLRTDTAILIVLSNVAFLVGSWWTGRPSRAPQEPTSERDAAERLWLATVGVALAAVAGAGLFLLQVASDFGVRAALVSSPEVRAAIQTGATFVTIKYVYVAFAAAVLAGLSAGLAESASRRRAAVGIVALSSFLTYFSTSRSNIFVAVLVGALAYAVARPHRVKGRQIVIGGAAVLAVGLMALWIGGSIIGKTFEASELATIDTVFTRHEALEPFATPYQYGTAPVGALNQLVAISGDVGGDLGCATVPLACDIGGAAGLGTSGTEQLRPFTDRPLRWNTYTGLDSPIMDGGRLLAVPIVLLLGLLAGFTWKRAREGLVPWMIVHTVMATATVTATGQNRYFAYHYVGAISIALAAWYVASRLDMQRWIREAPA